MNLEAQRNLMLSGDVYYSYEVESLSDEQREQIDRIFDLNQLKPSQLTERKELLRKILGQFGESSHIELPMFANWGKYTSIGEHVYINFNLTLVDDTTIEIKDHVMIGPNVTLATAGHPLDPNERLKQAQFNKPIVIEENAWLGAGVIILPGVTIGRNSVIGAGSVVTKDIPENVVAVGNPCRVVKLIK